MPFSFNDGAMVHTCELTWPAITAVPCLKWVCPESSHQKDGTRAVGSRLHLEDFDQFIYYTDWRGIGLKDETVQNGPAPNGDFRLDDCLEWIGVEYNENILRSTSKRKRDDEEVDEEDEEAEEEEEQEEEGQEEEEEEDEEEEEEEEEEDEVEE